MPHSTSQERATTPSRATPYKFPSTTMGSMTEKFPDHADWSTSQHDGRILSPSRSNSLLNGQTQPSGRWQPRREGAGSYKGSNGRDTTGTKGHGRQKSLSDAFKTIRARKGSVSANAHEIADALKAPVSPKLIILCIIWYFSSALTNTSSKSILNAFQKPATLTLIQFAFVSSYCLFFSWLATMFPNLKNAIPALRHGIRYPTREVIMTTLPLAGFQIGGHLLSSTATAKIPVSLVHTIKGLSPLFTVFAYRVIFNIRYPIATYLSLIPLTLGVMLACSAEFKGNVFGILYAFLAALIFVTQNIFSKRLFNEAAKAEADGHHIQSRKLDKLNLLYYSSGLAFLLTAPIWFWSEGIGLLTDFFHDGSLDLEPHPEAFDHGRLALEFVFNGTFHFGQNIIAFVLLSLVSPVTYSVASLIKRVFVVVIAIIWFQNPTTNVQAVGIALTFFGLYLYDRTSDSNKADRKARMMDIEEESLLPLNTRPKMGDLSAPVFQSPLSATSNGSADMHEASLYRSAKSGYTSGPDPYGNGYSFPNSNSVVSESKKSDDLVRGRPTGTSNASAWLPPGTRQEDTWRSRDLQLQTVRAVT